MNLAQKILIGSLLIAPLSGQTPDPGSLIFSKWTRDFQVPDPVAISFDEKGRAYVTQTQRRKANDLDIRNNRDWIPNDLSFTSPDDKRAFYQKVFTAENSSKNKRRVKDYNKDGRHDILDLQALTERIHLIEDTDGDGLADKTSIYAENFHDQIAGIAAGVLHHDGDVYTTIVPDVWKLRDTDDDGKADTRESIAYGFGAHLAYAGHDMHGLTVGPDGRIYWTIGDKGVSVKSKEGHHFKYPNQGAVLRCDPDGSNFEVYARGLRNVQEIAFDQYGNLFGVDNDSDRPGEKERFIYIVQHMDAGWRSNWQYRKGEFNPWMDENLSVPYQESQPAYVLPPISLYNNGPAGMAFNPGTALGEEWKDYFFHTSAPNGQQWAFQVEENGASYKMVNEMQIGNGVPIVGINFGPDGALYGVDWGGGYPL
ncbi:MAG: PVC-type heme-binding CxxCH protein, partial [Akkermansiaceae bacterium]